MSVLQAMQFTLLIDNRLAANAAKTAVIPIDSEKGNMC